MMAAVLLAAVEVIRITSYKSFPGVGAFSGTTWIPSRFVSGRSVPHQAYVRRVSANVGVGSAARALRWRLLCPSLATGIPLSISASMASSERGSMTMYSTGRDNSVDSSDNSGGNGGKPKASTIEKRRKGEDRRRGAGRRTRPSNYSTPKKKNNNNTSEDADRIPIATNDDGPGRNARANDRPKSTLATPPIIFTNNHLLIVNKPAGYSSQPNESLTVDPATLRPVLTDPKCLLTRLKVDGRGGGSRSDFLLPMHRLDQPCTGVILLAKNSKAGTRVGNAFRRGNVRKEYYCVVEGDIQQMIKRSTLALANNNGNNNNNGKGNGKDNGKVKTDNRANANTTRKVYGLSGVLKPTHKKGGGVSSRRIGGGRGNAKGGDNRSVRFVPLPPSPPPPPSDSTSSDAGRICHLEWSHLRSLTSNGNGAPVHLVSVRTGTGAKHQVRAMLAQLASAPICGDLRYGAGSALPDRSVALHARSIYLPTVTLGDMDLKKEPFVACIPSTWRKFFSLREQDLKG